MNAGWLNFLLHDRNRNAAYEGNADLEPNAEGLWDHLTTWGWAGPAFEHSMGQMLGNLGNVYHVRFHQGLEILGQCFGATTTRTTEQGAPDVIWSFPGDLHVIFEAKTEKKPTGELSKKDLLEAKGHHDCTQAKMSPGAKNVETKVVVVAPDASLHKVADPFAKGLYYAPPDEVLKMAGTVADNLRQLRVTFSGREFSEAAIEFSAGMRNSKLDIPALRNALLSRRLKES